MNQRASAELAAARRAARKALDELRRQRDELAASTAGDPQQRQAGQRALSDAIEAIQRVVEELETSP